MHVWLERRGPGLRARDGPPHRWRGDGDGDAAPAWRGAAGWRAWWAARGPKAWEEVGGSPLAVEVVAAAADARASSLLYSAAALEGAELEAGSSS